MDFTDEYNYFIANVTVRKSRGNFNDCWTDLVIEQSANPEANVSCGIFQSGSIICSIIYFKEGKTCPKNIILANR